VFLEEMLTELLEEIPMSLRKKMWFQHDRAAAHFALQIREHLTATYKDRWIGRGGPVAWPPRSPDLTPLDFFVWGYIKTLIYPRPVDSEEDLIARIAEAAANIRQEPGIKISAAILSAAVRLNIGKLVTNTTSLECFSASS
jgi:hypothetical protein